MRRHAGYGAVERIAYNNDIDKDIYQESFPTRAGKDFLCHKTDFMDNSIGHYGNYVRTCLNEKPRLKYCSTSSSYAEIKPKPVIRPHMVLSVYISFFQSSFRFPLASFCPIFLDIARYACQKPDENTLNIKQKYRLSPNTRFGLKRDRSSERRYLFSFMIIIRPTYPLYCRQ